jgi:hypothetical protein
MSTPDKAKRKAAPIFNPLATDEAKEAKSKRTGKSKAGTDKKPKKAGNEIEVKPPFECFFDDRKGRYYYTDGFGNWRGYGTEDFRRRLRKHDISGRNEEGSLMSPQDRVIDLIQHHHGIDFAGPVSGYFAGFQEANGFRILVTTSPKLPVPKAGDFATLHKFLSELFGVGTDAHGEQQFTVFCLWIARYFRAIAEQKPLKGHALLIAGPGGCGKNLLQEVVITAIAGGRMVKAADYLVGATDFSGFLFSGEHLCLSDDTSARDIRSRRELGQKIKDLVANGAYSMHHKGRDPMTLHPRWRLTVSVNDEAEHLQTLPPVADRDIRDKVHLFHVWPASIPETEDEQGLWIAAMVSEIPAFLAHVLTLEVPRHLKEERPRFGHREFHHPELLERLNSFSPELHLLQLVDSLLLEGWSQPEPWEGRASDLRSQLLDAADGKTAQQKEIADLLKSEAQTGQYLARLNDHHPERVQELPRKGDKRGWRIHPPKQDQEQEGEA